MRKALWLIAKLLAFLATLQVATGELSPLIKTIIITITVSFLSIREWSEGYDKGVIRGHLLTIASIKKLQMQRDGIVIVKQKKGKKNAK